MTERDPRVFCPDGSFHHFAGGCCWYCRAPRPEGKSEIFLDSLEALDQLREYKTEPNKVTLRRVIKTYAETVGVKI